MAEIRSSFLKACADGDVKLVKQLHSSESMNDIPFIQEAFTTAISNGQLDIVDFLLQSSSPTFTERVPDQVLLHALDAESEVYALFIRNNPAVTQKSFGHMGDALASAVMKNDIKLVQLLLDNGASPADSQIFHRPLLEVAQGMRHIHKDIMRVLNKEP